MVVRHYEAGTDHADVSEFLNRLAAWDGFPPLGETKFVDFGGAQAGRGIVAEHDGAISGYAHLLRHSASDVWELEIALDPEHRNVGSLEELLAAARSQVGGRLLWWAFGSEAAGLAEQLGLEVFRELHKLRGSLPPSQSASLPAWVEVRPFRSGDEKAWLEANNAAFAGHLENGNWTMADLEERTSRDWFHAAGFRLAWDEDRVAGFCWTKRHSPELGEIYVVAVHPDYRRRGLGRAIVIEGMHFLHSDGADACILYVDTSNPSALDLYQSLGFELERVDRCVVVPNV